MKQEIISATVLSLVRSIRNLININKDIVATTKRIAIKSYKKGDRQTLKLCKDVIDLIAEENKVNHREIINLLKGKDK